ncbi:MAG TPA: spherulation-specific family 4 protein, partial [Kineosporiaceae bacterium]|nr:spherulation-specific family 4 protein [Kineosporiaceae bacterium]
MVTNPAPRPPDEPSGHLDGDLVLDLTNELPSLSHVKVDLAVPAYVHPLVDPEVWDRLVDVARHLRFVVLNVDSGPGAVLDPAYPPVIERLRAARARTVGYVDTDYGRRDIEDVVAEARSWVLRYGVHGVFFDQVAGDFEHLEYYVACALGARANGAHFVVLNPGTDCHPGF